VRALVLRGVRDLRLEEVEEPKVSEGEVLIRVGACGICGTDLHFYRGEWRVKTPLVPGHEFSGVVEEVGPGAEWVEVGSRVVAEPNVTCGRCYYCRMEKRNFYCPNIKAVGVDVNGAFAEYVKVPAANVYRFPDWMSFEEAALIEPLACCVRGLYNVGIEPGDTVAVVGAGPVGLLMVQLAKMWGASRVYAIDLIERRLSLAKQLGADVVVNAAKERRGRGGEGRHGRLGGRRGDRGCRQLEGDIHGDSLGEAGREGPGVRRRAGGGRAGGQALRALREGADARQLVQEPVHVPAGRPHSLFR